MFAIAQASRTVFHGGAPDRVTATKRVIERLKVENTVRTRKTALERIDTPLWDEKAVREAVINAIVHNDYTREVPPKVELFSDHLEITSFGRLPEGLTKDDFFAGVSIPRNKELMRIFRDLELVESLGSGMGYIMQKYGRENFIFLDNFIRMTVPYITKDREGQAVSPQATPQVTPQVAPQVNLLILRLLKAVGHREKSVAQLLVCTGIKGRKDFRTRYLTPALEQGLIEMSQPDSPRSPTQKYRLTAKGMAALASYTRINQKHTPQS